MKPLELAMLKYLTRQALVKAKKELMRDRTFEPFAQVIRDEEGHIVDVPFRGEWMESGRKKDVLFALLAEICRRTEAPGLIIVTDGWGLEHTSEQRRRFQTDPAYRQEFELVTSSKGLRAAAAAGLGKLVETIVCQGQTREHVYGQMQYYERVAKSGVIPASEAFGDGARLASHTIRFRGEAQVLSSEADRFAAGGRMFSLFERNEEPAPPELTDYIARMVDKFTEGEA